MLNKTNAPVIKKLKPTFAIYRNNIYHYGGMRVLQDKMCEYNLYDTESKIYFLDTVEIFFLTNNIKLDKDWCGIIHWCPLKNSEEDWIKMSNLNFMFTKKNFIYSLKKCK